MTSVVWLLPYPRRVVSSSLSFADYLPLPHSLPLLARSFALAFTPIFLRHPFARRSYPPPCGPVPTIIFLRTPLSFICSSAQSSLLQHSLCTLALECIQLQLLSPSDLPQEPRSLVSAWNMGVVECVKGAIEAAVKRLKYCHGESQVRRQR